MKKYIFLFFIFISFSFAQEIKSYFVKNEIKSNGSVYIVENIKYYFDTPKHGIYRDIPLQIKVKNKIKNIKFKLDYVLLNNKKVPFSKSFIDLSNIKNIRIKIGSKDKLISKENNFTIAYELEDIIIPNCKENKDCISLNSIGNRWKVNIYNVKIFYKLPQILVNKVELKVYTGKFRQRYSNATIRWLDDSFVEIYVDKLAPYNGLTTTFVYPHNLIKKNNFNYWYILFFLALFSYIYKLHKSFIKNNKSSIVPFYNPPKDISTIEAGVILDAKAESKDFLAAIIELAVKGYLKIIKKDNLTLIKKIDKDSKNLTLPLKEFYNLLFKDSNIFVLEKNENIANKLQKIFNRVNETIYDFLVQKGFFQEEPIKSRKRFIFKTLPFVTIFSIYSLYDIINNFGIDYAIFLILPSIFFIVSSSIFFNSSSIFEKLIASIFFFVAALLIYFNFDNLDIFLSPYMLNLILIIYLLYIYQDIVKYTQKGASLKSYLLGLKEFISRVKEDELKRRLKEDPLYLEKLLPYAIIFGISSHWLDYFINFGVTPIWYEGEIDTLNSFESDFNNASNFSNSSNSSSDFGGDGFSSGGGVGGGGGDSW